MEFFGFPGGVDGTMVGSKKSWRVYIGTSGFYYDSWYGKFYPDDLSKRKLLEYYSGVFNTVELNSTFYHLPKESTVMGWCEKVGRGFLFSVKVSKYITHRLKLKGAHEPLELFFSRVRGFGRKLGVVLFQLPPSLKRDDDLLASFLSQLPSVYRYAIEFRHESWFDEGVYQLLKEADVAFCAQSHPRLPETLVVTSRIIYVRFHGVPKLYTSSYSDGALRRWAKELKEASGGKREIFCYFNNDVEGHAVENAMTLRKYLTGTL